MLFALAPLCVLNLITSFSEVWESVEGRAGEERFEWCTPVVLAMLGKILGSGSCPWLS